MQDKHDLECTSDVIQAVEVQDMKKISGKASLALTQTLLCKRLNPHQAGASL
jgi:hypothetical protein